MATLDSDDLAAITAIITNLLPANFATVGVSTGGIIVSTNTNGDNLATVLNTAEILAAIANISSPGSGMHLVTFIIKQANGTLIADCDINITTSSAGPNTGYITTNRSDANGEVNFYLDAGTYYGWKQKAGITFSSNPFQFSVDDEGAIEIL